MPVAESNVVEFGHPVTVVLRRSLHALLAEAGAASGLSVEEEIVARLARSFQRRRASDAMDDFLAAACRPTEE